MKKFLTALTFAAVFLLQGYEVMLWGDMHYSRPRHLAEVKSEKVLNYCRSLEKQWETYNPELMKRCAVTGRNCDFGVVLGDMTDGHYGTVEKHVEALQTMTGELRARWSGKPIEFVKGNHENFDGPAAREGYAKALPGGLNRFKLHRGDLYIFFNSEEPDFAFVQKALTSHPEAKQVFFFTHKPVAPCCRNEYALDLVFANDLAKRDALLKLLADRRAAIFCGHVHELTRTVFTEPQTGRTLVQISLFSMVYALRRTDGSSVAVSGAEFMKGDYIANSFKRFKKLPAAAAELWQKALVSWESYRPVAGFGILQKEHGDAVLLLYNWSRRETPIVLDLTPQK